MRCNDSEKLYIIYYIRLNMIHRLFIFGFFLFHLTAFSQNAPAKTNLAHFLQEGNEMTLEYMYSSTGELLVYYDYVNLPSLEVHLVSYESVKSKKPESEELLYSKCADQGCKFVIGYTDLEDGLLHFIQFKDLNNEEIFLFRITSKPPYTSDVRLLNAIDDWQPDSYFLSGTEVYPTSDSGNPITVQIYQDPFDPADSPTGGRKPSKKGLEPSEVFTISSGDLLVLDKRGMYYLQTDVNSMTGLGFRVEDQPYPRYNRLDDLGNSMIYLTTKREQEILATEDLDKNTFDSVWLGMSGTETTAKAAIRNYFRGIQNSNKMFTSYKEGWKTDKGLIYTAFGAPSEVYLTDEGESWIYEETKNHEKMEFAFFNYPTVFSPYHSILQRKKEYSLPWNRTIDRLRRGITNYE